MADINTQEQAQEQQVAAPVIEQEENEEERFPINSTFLPNVQGKAWEPDKTGVSRKTPDEAQTWFNHWIAKLDAEKERALRKTEGRMLGTSLGELGTTIGEMIRARNGAVVTPRDIQKQYDELGRQEQLAYDTYFNRMDALRKAKAAQDEAEKERGAAAALAGQKNTYDWMKFIAGKQADAALAADKNDTAVRAAEINAQGRVDAAKAGSRRTTTTTIIKEDPELEYDFVIGGKTFTRKGHAGESENSEIFNDLKSLGIITENDMVKDEVQEIEEEVPSEMAGGAPVIKKKTVHKKTDMNQNKEYKRNIVQERLSTLEEYIENATAEEMETEQYRKRLAAYKKIYKKYHGKEYKPRL